MKKITQCSSRAVAMLLMMLAMCLPQKMFAYNQPTLGSDGYYQIATASNLFWLRDYVNAGNNTVNARITANIDMKPMYTSTACWGYMGTSSCPFKGILDGNGKTISNMRCYPEIDSNSHDIAAFVGYNSGTIKNLTLAGVSIKHNNNVSYVAGVAGYNNAGGTISGCTVSGTIAGYITFAGIAATNLSAVENCTSNASIYMDGWSGSSGYCGGIVGDANGTSTEKGCVNNGSILVYVGNGSKSVGGIAGRSFGTTTNCINNGKITGYNISAGGIVGELYSYVSNCISRGNISYTASSSEKDAGAIIADNRSSLPTNITNNYYLSTLTIKKDGSSATIMPTVGIGSDHGDIAGTISTDSATFASGKIARLLNGGDGTKESATGAWGQVLGTDTIPAYMTANNANAVYNVSIIGDTNYYGNSGKVVTIPSAVNHYVDKKIYTGDYTSNGTAYSGTYKIASSDVTLSQTLCDMSTLTETGTDSKTYYKISTPAQMKWFEYYVNDSTAHAATCAKLMNDINLSSICSATAGNWTPIASTTTPYTGIFDGNGKTISGLYISINKYWQALFCLNSGTIKNLTVDAAMIHGSRLCAAIASINWGMISGCTSKGSIIGTKGLTGGITGSNASNIDHCTNEATISGISNVGGIAGENEKGSISYCFNRGEISGSGNGIGGIVGYSRASSDISNSVNLASVTGYGPVGGIVGYHVGSVKNCYNTANVTSLGDYTYTTSSTSTFIPSLPGAIVGYNIQGSITNCYYLSTITLLKSNAATALVGSGDGTGEANTYSKTADEFKSGQIARLLNGGDGTIESATSVWGQTLGTDTYPVLMTANNANAVYSLIINKKNNYGNTGKKFTLPAQLTYADLFIIADTCRDANKTIYKDSCKISNADLALTETIDTTFMTKLTETATDGKTYYQISTPLQMKWFEYYVNKSTANAATCAKLMNDINLSSICSATAGNWTPIANSNAGYSTIFRISGPHYSGIFDGNGKTISGLYINATASDYQALFCSNGGTIKNLTVDANINGGSYCAVISSGNDGTISGCTAKGTITGVASYIAGIAVLNRSDIEHCANEATVKSGNPFVGGIAAQNQGNVNYCTNLGAVSSTKASYVGGIAGENFIGSMTNCYNQASISGYGDVGGIAGISESSVKDCYNTANVTSLGNFGSKVSSPGAIVGYNNSYGGTITNCYYLSTITLKRNDKDTTLVGVGNGTNEAYTYSKTADEFKSGIVARLLNGGDGTTESAGSSWGQTIGTDTVPVFLASDKANAVCSVTINSEKSYHNANTTISLPDNGFGINGTKYGTVTGFSDGTKAYTGSYAIATADVTLNSVFENGGDMADHLSNGYYQISTPEQLKWLAYYVNDANSSAAANAMLMNDIDLSTVCNATAGNWTPIGTTNCVFSYKFNGNGKTVSNLYIDKATTDDQGLFGRTGLSATIMDLNVSGTVSSSALRAAILVGNNYGTISGCTSSGTVSSSNIVGGIAGGSYGSSITQCVNHATINDNSNHFNCIGGITGWNAAILTDCVNFGVIKSLGSPENSVGGIVGYNAKTIKNCENLGQVYVDGALTEAYPILGADDNGKSTATNCYYLSASTTAATYGTPKTAAEFKSGIVARLLNGGDGTTESAGSSWGQTIGTDTVPVFLASDNKNAVYRLVVNKTIKDYGNNGGTVDLTSLSAGDATFDDTKINMPGNYTNGTTTYTDTYTYAAADDSIKSTSTTVTDMATLTETGTDGKTYYKISTPAQMKWFAYYVNKSSDNLATCAKLMKDIDLTTVCSATAGNWTPIAQSSTNVYNGIFDGNGKTISNLYIANATTDNQGLFGYTNDNAIIKDLNISGNVSSSVMNVELLVAFNLGKIIRCTSSGTVSGNGYTSGIAGDNSGSIIQCMNYASINDKQGLTGGIAAHCNYGAVTNCANFGTIKATTNGYTSTGGIVGVCGNTSTIKNCENLGQVYVADALTEAYPILGIDKYGKSTITNNYYLSASNDTAKYGTPKTWSDFKHDNIARLLNGGDGTKEVIMGTWGQTMGIDNHPVFMTADKKNAVYHVDIYWGTSIYGSCYINAGNNGTSNQMFVLDSIADVSMLGTNEISSDGKANSIVLTDKYIFGLPFDITAQSVTYTRDAYCDGYHETICLPFVPTTVPDGYDFSEYKSTSESKNTIYFTDATSWTAGKPYLMKYTGTPSSTQQTVTFSATNATVLAAPLTEDVFVGDFTGESQKSSEYILGVYDGKEIFRKTTDSYKTSPFRAHLNITTTTGAKENYSIDFGDDTTGISAAAALRNDGCIYDLQGRRIQIPVKGNVYIQDGKKFIYQK